MEICSALTDINTAVYWNKHWECETEMESAVGYVHHEMHDFK